MSIMRQFNGVHGAHPLDTNPVARGIKINRQQAGMPVDEQIRISYGVIAQVDDKTNKVKINISDHNGKLVRLGSNDINQDGLWIPIIQPLEIIHHLYGALRKGLLVKIYWKGKSSPGAETVAEVFSDATIEEFRAAIQGPRSNELTTGPHEIYCGGVNL